MPKNERLKKAIEEIKLIHKLKQAEIAAELAVTGTYLSDMVNGRVPLTDSVINRLSELFHISTAWLRTGKGSIMTYATANEPEASYNSNASPQKAATKNHEQTIKALKDIIAAKDEIIRIQQDTIEALKGEVEVLRKMTGLSA